MLLNAEQAEQYRDRVTRIEALKQMAHRAADQANALSAQAREHQRNVELLERELYQCFLPSIERDLGLPDGQHYVEQAWQIVTIMAGEATVKEVSAEAPVEEVSAEEKQDVASSPP